jgi:hypothetical protein
MPCCSDSPRRACWLWLRARSNARTEKEDRLETPHHPRDSFPDGPTALLSALLNHDPPPLSIHSVALVRCPLRSPCRPCGRVVDDGRGVVCSGSTVALARNNSAGPCRTPPFAFAHILDAGRAADPSMLRSVSVSVVYQSSRRLPTASTWDNEIRPLHCWSLLPRPRWLLPWPCRACCLFLAAPSSATP